MKPDWSLRRVRRFHQFPGILILVLLLLSSVVNISHSSLHRPFVVELDSSQRLQLASSIARDMFVGRVEAVADTIDRNGHLHHTLYIQTTEWLKGDKRGQRAIIDSPAYNSDGSILNELRRTNTRSVVVFAKTIRGRLTLIYAGPAAPGGLILLDESPGNRAIALASIRAAVLHTSQAEVARSADVILVGRIAPDKLGCVYRGRRVPASRVAVDSLITGSVDSRSIYVVGPTGMLDENGPAILSLHRVSLGVYERVGFEAGQVSVEGTVIAETGEQVATYAARLRALAR